MSIDPRWFQIAVLGSALTYGLTHWDLTLTQVAVTVVSGLLAQVVGQSFLSDQRQRLDLKSGLITTLSLSLLLRSNHLELIAALSFAAVASKFFLRFDGKHIFSPANFSLGLGVLLLSNWVWISPAHGGRPVYSTLTRAELAKKADFVFQGWPSQQPPVRSCANELGRWQVHRVYKGNKTLEGKIIAVAANNYRLIADVKKSGGKAPSYQAWRYENAGYDTEQASFILYTNEKPDGCFELAAEGAQDHRFEEIQVEALFAPEDCGKQKKALEQLSDRMPRDCQVHADCKLFYAHPNSCERPFLWSKEAEAKLDGKFLDLQARMRSACGAEWHQQAACSPIVFPFRCRANKCEEGYASPKAQPKFSRGEMRASCAPHDAPSMSVSLRAVGDYPVFNMNWWKNRPSVGGGTFTQSGSGSNGWGEGFTAAFCIAERQCSVIQSIDVKLVWPKDAKRGSFEYRFKTQNGDSFSGAVPIDYQINSSPALCG